MVTQQLRQSCRDCDLLRLCCALVASCFCCRCCSCFCDSNIISLESQTLIPCPSHCCVSCCYRFPISATWGDMSGYDIFLCRFGATVARQTSWRKFATRCGQSNVSACIQQSLRSRNIQLGPLLHSPELNNCHPHLSYVTGFNQNLEPTQGIPGIRCGQYLGPAKLSVSHCS